MISTGLASAERIPANLLLEAGIRLYPGDQLLVNGQAVDPTRRLAGAGSPAAGLVLQYRPAVPVTVAWEPAKAGQARTFASTAATLGEALWEAGIRVNPEDRLEPALSTLLAQPVRATLRRAVPLAIRLQDQVLSSRSAADTVGEALAAAGVALQGLDYAVPGEGAPLPADGQIRVVRVRENALLEQVHIPFKSEYQADPQTELDQKSILQPGVTGLRVSRIRVRTEDGKEVARKQESEWIAREPKTQLVGYGTQAVVHTETVDGITIEYWRKVTAYATSYTACSAGSCSGRTASGQPVTRGVVAVIRSWYNQMRGQQVYVPGYGTGVIADIGGGVPGQNWIDLGYGEGDYVPWHSTVTIYFLAPVPAVVPWSLP